MRLKNVMFLLIGVLILFGLVLGLRLTIRPKEPFAELLSQISQIEYQEYAVACSTSVEAGSRVSSVVA